MAALRQTLDQDRKAGVTASAATHSLLEELLDRMGKPAEGRAPATGVYAAVDAVSERVKPFEGLWLQVKGGVKTAAFLLIPFGIIMWFLAGDKLTKLFAG